MDDSLARLEAEYCPLLDPALVSAILSDYDLTIQKSVESAKTTLDELKADALVHEAIAFDPPGTGANENGIDSHVESIASLSHETESTSVSNGLSLLELEDGHTDVDGSIASFDEVEDLDRFDENAKVKRLHSIFGGKINRYSIQYTLKKCNGNWNAAVEDLLSQAYVLDANNVTDGDAIKTKGIDAFSEEGTVRRGRKGKPKNRRLKIEDRRRSNSLPALDSNDQTPAPNKWKSATDDIEFIASRMRLSTAVVSSVYYEKVASVPQTIGALLKASMEESKHIVTDQAAVFSEAQKLYQEFPNVSPDYLDTIVRLTYPSTATAHELATALTATPKGQAGEGIQIVPQLVPLEGLDAGSNWIAGKKKSSSTASSRSMSPDMASATFQRDTYSIARGEAFAKASAAHRKAKSDRLMGGAAAYYGQVGREYAALSSNASAQAADALVDSQSTPTQLDLHGVDVANATRIARERVEEWWDSLGESRVNGRIGAEDRQTGYRIVVGLGRHSEGGKGKLGPAVMKMLRQEGWKAESAGAVLVIKGPAKR